MRQESRAASPPSRLRSWDLGNSAARVKSRGKPKWRRVITRSVGVLTLSTRRSPAVPFIGDVSCGCCPEGAISATVARVVDSVFVDFDLRDCFAIARAIVVSRAVEVECRCCSRWAFECSADNGATELRLPRKACLSLGIAHESFL